MSSPDSKFPPYLKLDVGRFVPRIRPGVLFRSAWGVEPGLPGAVGDSVDKIDMRGRKHVTPEELALDHRRIAVIPVEQPAGPAVLRDGATREEYAANYLGLLEHCGPALAQVVETIALQLERGGSVVGCSIGRDRTGMVLALSLRGLGLPTAEILRAETAMRERLADLVEISPHTFEGMTREQVAHRLRAPHEPVADALADCERRWTSARAYLARHGMAQGTWERLARCLLAEAGDGAGVSSGASGP